MENLAPTQNESALVPNFNISGNLPDLSKATVTPLELNGEYWSPVQAGEKRRLFFNGLRVEKTLSQDGKEVELLVAYFIEPTEDGKYKYVRQASRRLTAIFEDNERDMKPGMAFEITYKGKIRNKTNSFSSDNWGVSPLNV